MGRGMQTQVAGVPWDGETFHVWRGEMQGDESGDTAGAEGSRLCELQGLRTRAARQGKGYVHTGGVTDGAPPGSTALGLQEGQQPHRASDALGPACLRSLSSSAQRTGWRETCLLREAKLTHPGLPS